MSRLKNRYGAITLSGYLNDIFVICYYMSVIVRITFRFYYILVRFSVMSIYECPWEQLVFDNIFYNN